MRRRAPHAVRRLLPPRPAELQARLEAASGEARRLQAELSASRAECSRLSDERAITEARASAMSAMLAQTIEATREERRRAEEAEALRWAEEATLDERRSHVAHAVAASLQMLQVRRTTRG